MLPTAVRMIGRLFLFIAGGIVVIIVGFFMLRGNMRMWDRDDDDRERASGGGGGSGGGSGDGRGDGAISDDGHGPGKDA